MALTSLPALGAVATLLGGILFPSTSDGQVTTPPVHAGFDYQIGGPYTPPAGVQVVSRDHDASPAAGLYNIC